MENTACQKYQDVELHPQIRWVVQQYVGLQYFVSSTVLQ